ncbi:MAG: VOC family protein [Candidatus Thiodiazotropha taylori]
MRYHESIDYVEFPASDLEVVKVFFKQVFGWDFVDYGKDYCAFSNAGLDGGFYHSELTTAAERGSALIVFYSRDLEKTQAKIIDAGGRIKVPVFEFTGGRRFHFCDPTGNEYAVWSDVQAGSDRV